MSSNIFFADNCLSEEIINKYKENTLYVPDIVYYEINGIKFPYEYQKDLCNLLLKYATIIHTKKANDFCSIMRIKSNTNSKKNMLKYDLVTESTLEALQKVSEKIKNEPLIIIGSNDTVFEVLDVPALSFLKNYRLIGIEQ